MNKTWDFRVTKFTEGVPKKYNRWESDDCSDTCSETIDLQHFSICFVLKLEQQQTDN